MTADDVIAAVRAAVRKYPSAKPLKDVRDAQQEAAKAAKAASRILIRELPGLSAEERGYVLFEALKATNLSALTATARMQRTRAEAYGEEQLGVADPGFNAERARHLVVYADSLYAEGEDGELSESQEHALADVIENNARLCVDDAERELADARYNMGLKAYIVRSAVGAETCEECLSLAGEYEYYRGMDTECFWRHTSCDCLIEYHRESGQAETIRNYRLNDKEMQRLMNKGE